MKTMKTVLVLMLGTAVAGADEIDVIKAKLVTPKVVERFHAELGLTEEQKEKLLVINLVVL